MPLTRLDNLISSKTGKYLYVSPDDFNASDALDNRGTSPTRPFLTIQRAFLEVARYSYVPGSDNDRFDQFTILLAPGTHYIDNRPGDATASGVPVFNYSAGEWNDTTSFDLSDPNNVLRRFNSVEGGCIIPRGTSLVGTDLRRTQLRPLYVPDPADKDVGRTSLFQVTGGCYFWQFTIQDGDLTVNSPLWDSVQNIGKVYSQPDSTVLSIPEYSHHKITNFVFARKEDLGALYAKVAKAFSAYQPTIDDPGEFDYRIQENRIVGPLSDSVTIESIKVDNITTGALSGTADITVNTKINHGYFVGQYVAITGMNAGQGKLNGVWKVKSISSTNLKQFVFNVPYNAAGLGLVPSGATWTESTTPKLSSVGTTASVQAEVDSVESASPYVFNVSIRSTWGICGIWADGSRATGFKSMVIAQYTGVSLQKDDRAFIKYDEFTNTWNQANLQDAFSSTPYHIDGTAYWKDDWRNFHVRASEDAFIQNVSIFAVGFADHFLMESGGDMSITNSNSNFGNTSLHTIGYKNYAFNQDKGGYISHIVPPKKLLDTEIDIKNYYTLNVTLSNDATNNNRLYYGIDESSDPTDRPAGSIDGFKLGAKSGEKLYVKLDAVAGESGKQIKSAIVSPNGVKKWRAALTALSPTGQVVGDLDGDGDSNDAQDVRQYNLRQDAANLIDSNKAFIQSEAFGYILEKYPSLQSTPYVNPGVTGDTNRYRDASNLIRSNRQEIVDRAFAQISLDYDETSWGTNWVVPGDTVTTATSRFKDAYRLIQKNRDIIAETALAAIQTNFPAFVYPGATPTERDANKVKCRRDIGHFIDAVSLDIVLGGGNKYTRKFILQYFNSAGSPITGGLQGEEAQSNAAFSIATEAMKAALTNSLTTSSTFTNSTYATTPQTAVVSTPYNGSWLSGSTTGTLAIYQDTSITAGPASYGGGGGPVSNTSASSCADVRSALDSLTTIVTGVIAAGNTSSLVAETAAPSAGNGETKCKRDIGYIVDALISDLYNGANSASIDAARAYFTSTNTTTITPSTGNATASVTSTQLSGTLPSTLFPAAGSSGQNPDVSWSFSLPTPVTNAGISISSYDLLLEDLHAVDSNGFPKIHWRIDNIPSTVTSIPTNAAQLNIPGATFRPNYVGSPNTTGVSPVGYTGPEPGTENHTYRLTIRANLNNSSSTVVSSLQFNYDNTYAAPTVSGSYSLPRPTLRANNVVVNYNLITVINAGTPISGGLVGEEAQSVVAFNKIATEAKKALTNQLYVKDLTILADPVTGSNTSSSSCANVRTTVDSLISIVTTAISNANLNSLPPRNGGSWLGSSKCKRDIGYIVEAVTSDLRLGGNENVVNAAEAYYVGTNLDYINNELNETLDAYNYVRDLTIAAMRNWSFQIQNASTTSGSSVVTVASTVGIVMGMRVSGTGIPANTFVKRIISGTTFELGDSDSRLTTGNTVNATSTSTTTTLTLTLDAGIWAEVDNLAPITDSSVVPDTNYPECAGVATAISTYFTAISTILNSGLGTVSKSPATVSGSSISTRATLFTLTEVATSSTNPHDLETGTPVRLVPRAINETVDKRVVRLPKGFDSNTKYYVIAPGRSTEPFNFSNYTSPSGNVPFDGSAATQQAIMLATSIENANAGIYIYSPETESIDPNVVIEVHQYVQDVKYDLIQYRCSIVPGSNSVFETEGPHGFDKQQTNTTPQKVFFRGGAQTPDISGSILPTRTTGGTLPDNVEYFVRYVPPTAGQQRNTRFTIHTSHSDAISGTNEVTFSNAGTSFYVFSNKRRSPIKFAPEVNLQDTTGNKGCWYINTSSTNNEILERLKLPVYDDTRGKTRTTDTWFERVRDERTVSDTVYRLRYVIPKDGNYREPINGFVFKIRTDETRRLLPQKILLKPVGSASSFANVTKNGERLGLTNTEQINGSAYNTANPNFVSSYDPYVDPFTIETDSKINFSVQSAKKVRVSSNDYLELTVFDVSVVDAALKTSILTTVKVDTPQGGTGNFVVGNNITWSGNSTGSGVVHAWFPTHNYLIIKNAIGELKYNPSTSTTFTQGSVTARMLEDKDGGRSDRSKYLYAVEGANVYTMTPGDTVTLPVTTGGTAQYRIDTVQDVSDLENTYYVFKSETIRKRIKGQQDGIYYITAIRGDIRPFPTGSGVGTNFRNFKFSQPVSRIYPLATKNDPLWFQVTDSVVNQENPNRDTTIIDPPETVSTADNYVHGYVSVNDAKRSVTKEAVLDLTKDPGVGLRTYTNENRIQAKEGAASAGSEARRIPIAGDSDFPTEQKIYVELRRPSIARSGNHTFEYLGFGPGNYSTGFPARQQVILTDIQDFYAQAKREDAGLVLYTGLNSSGDLYIGNRKINAITGEETLLDAPITEEEDEEVGIAGALVTTFDDPVTFNNTVTFNYNQVIPATLSVVTVGVPVLINSEAVNTSGAVVKPPLSIQNYTAEATQEEYDPLRNGLSETMTFGNNIAYFGVWKIAPRGSQGYSIRTHKNNVTPNTQPSSAAPYNNFYSTTQLLNITNGNWGNIPAKAGTILYKGSQVNYSGSLGWIYANDYTALTTTGVTPQVTNIQTFVGYTVVKVSFSDTLGNLGIKPDTQFRTTNSSNAILNSGVDGVPFSIPGSVLIDAATAGGSQISEAGYPGASSNYVWINIAPNAAVSSVTQLASNLGPINISISNSFWKEVGVIGAEAIRTETQSLGNYKLGVNTLARATDTAYQNAFVQTQTLPVANLDVEGNAFISGKATASSISSGGTNTKAITNVDNALLVGGAYLTPSNTATLRVATTDNGSATTTYQTGGRVGINVPFADLDRNLTVRGNARITGDFKFENNIEVNGTTTATSATLSTTNTTFNLINTNATTLNFAGALTVGNLFNTATTTQDLNIGTAATGITSLDIHTSTTDSTINIGTVGDTNNTYKSLITIGGAYARPNDSIFRVKNFQTILNGNLQIEGDTLNNTATINSSRSTINLFTQSGSGTTLRFGTFSTNTVISAVAGTTTIQNNLIVKAGGQVFSSFKMNGGYLSASAGVTRGVLGTAATSHALGTTTTLNIDYYRFIDNIDGSIVVNSVSANTFTVPTNTQYFDDNQIIRFVDVTGLTGVNTTTDYYVINPTASTFQVSLVNSGPPVAIGGAVTSVSATLKEHTVYNTGYVDWSATDTNLPLNNPKGIGPNEYLLIDNEIVKTTNFPSATSPYLVPVLRGQEGTTAAIHSSGAVIYKLEKTPGASYITPNPIPSGDITKTGTGVITMNTSTNFLTTTGTNLVENYIVQFTNLGGITSAPAPATPVAINTPYYIVNLTTAGGSQSFQLSTTPYPSINALDLEGSITAATSFSVDADIVNLAEFGGSFGVNDYLRLDGTYPSGSGAIEFVRITSTPQGATKKFTITDGAASPTTTFEVDSVTGNTTILGNLNLQSGFTLSGSTVCGTQLFKINDGAVVPADVFTVDSCNGDTVIGKNGASGGSLTIGNDLQIKSNIGGTTFFSVDAQTGNTVIGNGNDGTLRIEGNATSTSTTTGALVVDGGVGIAENLNVGGDATVAGGDLTVTSGGTTRFKVNNSGRIDLGGIENYISTTGGRKWQYVTANTTLTTPNVNVVVFGGAADIIITLPSNPQTGDTIRFLDISGVWTYNRNLVIRCPLAATNSAVTVGTTQYTGVAKDMRQRLQGDFTGTRLGGLPAAYDAGELVIQTRNAGFGLVYIGPQDSFSTLVNANFAGWWLMEI